MIHIFCPSCVCERNWDVTPRPRCHVELGFPAVEVALLFWPLIFSGSSLDSRRRGYDFLPPLEPYYQLKE